MRTLRGEIIDLLNEMVKLLGKATSEDEKNNIRKKRRLLEAQLYEVIDQEISNSTPEFNQAISALEAATKKAKEAKDDLQKVADTVKLVAKAAEMLEKVVQVGISVIA